MSFIAGILTFLLIVNCAVLVLLILVQLPKKDAGAGLAFGGGTADALFGAGSGNALTKITKWATVAFIALAVILGSLETRMVHSNQNEFEQGVEQQQQMHTSAGQPELAPRPATTHPAASSSPSSALPLPLSPGSNGASPTTAKGK